MTRSAQVKVSQQLLLASLSDDTHIYLSLSSHLSLFACLSLSLHMCVSLSSCLSLSLHMSVSLSLYMSVSLFSHVSLFTCLSLSSHMSLSRHVCLSPSLLFALHLFSILSLSLLFAPSFSLLCQNFLFLFSCSLSVRKSLTCTKSQSAQDLAHSSVGEFLASCRKDLYRCSVVCGCGCGFGGCCCCRVLCVVCCGVVCGDPSKRFMVTPTVYPRLF